MNETLKLEVEHWYLIPGEGPMQYLPFKFDKHNYDNHFIDPDGGSYYCHTWRIDTEVSQEWADRWVKYRNTMLLKDRDPKILEEWAAWAWEEGGEGTKPPHIIKLKEKS